MKNATLQEYCSGEPLFELFGALRAEDFLGTTILMEAGGVGRPAGWSTSPSMVPEQILVWLVTRLADEGNPIGIPAWNGSRAAYGGETTCSVRAASSTGQVLH